MLDDTVTTGGSIEAARQLLFSVRRETGGSRGPRPNGEVLVMTVSENIRTIATLSRLPRIGGARLKTILA